MPLVDFINAARGRSTGRGRKNRGTEDLGQADIARQTRAVLPEEDAQPLSLTPLVSPKWQLVNHLPEVTACRAQAGGLHDDIVLRQHRVREKLPQ